MSSEQWLAEMHIRKTREKALRLFAFTSSVFPVEWIDQWNLLVIPDLVEFAFHARRINELCGLKSTDFESINKKIFTVSTGDPGNWEERYQHALNRIVHAREFKVGQAHADHRKLFTSSKANLITLYVTVGTDLPGRGTASISIFGLVDCFLTRVIREIKGRFPTYQF